MPRKDMAWCRQSPRAGAIEPGFHVTADSIVGRACVERLPMILEDALAATAENCPYGGITRPIGSVAVVPVVGALHTIGALVVEGKAVGAVGPHEGRNVGLLAAIARGPLEIVWEIEEVSRRARTDPLTGLPNRRHFDEQLRRVVAETDRFGGTCSLVLVDLDHFKAVNDQYGHDAGDTVLRHVAACWATRCGRWTCARGMAGKRSGFCFRRRRRPERSSSPSGCGRRSSGVRRGTVGSRSRSRRRSESRRIRRRCRTAIGCWWRPTGRCTRRRRRVETA